MCRPAIPPTFHSSTVLSLTVLLLLLLLLLISPASPKSEQPDCVELICALERDNTHFELAGGKKCERCEQCSENGYSTFAQVAYEKAATLKRMRIQSVCVQSMRRMDDGAAGCECTHSGPNVVRMEGNKKRQMDEGTQQSVCRLPPTPNAMGSPKKKTGEGPFRFCFSSAIRKMPMPEAKNDFEKQPPDVLVSVEQFWLTDYWRALKPSELHLFYVFPVAQQNNCEGKLVIPNANDLMWINAGKSKEEVAKQKSIWLCKADLQIDMLGEAGGDLADQQHPSDIAEGDDVAEDPPAEEDFPGGGEDIPPEVVFERNVFAGAERVRLYYEVTVQRDNQLKQMTRGKVNFEQRTTKVQSEPLDFDLDLKQYQHELHRSGSSNAAGRGGLLSAAPKERVDIDQRKSTSKEPIVRPFGATKSAEQKTTRDGAITAVPVPGSTSSVDQQTGDQQQIAPSSSSSPAQPSTGRAGRIVGEGTERTVVEAGGGRGEAEADWELLRNVLLISLLCLLVLVGLAICYKKGLGCFGGTSGSNASMGKGAERNGKRRNMNGNEYIETGQS